MSIKKPSLALGTAQLGQDYGISNESGEPFSRRAEKILSTAADLGVQKFDTAPVYGESEEYLGNHLNNRFSDKEIKVVTKVKLSSKDSPVQEINQSIRNSLERLQLSNLYGVLLHDVSVLQESGMEVVDALKGLKGSGLTEHIGVSVYEPNEVNRTMDWFDPEIVQFPLNIFDRRFLNSDVSNFLSRGSVDAWVRSCFLQGLLFLEPDKLSAPLVPLRPYLRKFRSWIEDRNISVPEACLGFLKPLEPINTIIAGVDNYYQLKHNHRVLQEVEPLFHDINNQLTLDFDSDAAQLLDPRTW